jgi:MFS family permease
VSAAAADERARPHARALRTRLRQARDAFALNVHNRDLRRAQLSFACAWTSEWMLTVGLGIVAFEDGGVGAVGVIALVRMLPGAIAGPVLAGITDRMRRERVIVAIGVVRGVCLGLMALLIALAAPTLPSYALAVVSTVAGAPFRPAHSALLPILSASPEQLTSASVVRGMLASASTLLGPLAAAALLAVSTPAAVFAAAGIASALSAALVLRLEYEPLPRPAAAAGAATRGGPLRQLRALAAERDLALVIALGVSQTFTRGCLNVLVVVIAIELLDLRDAGVGFLSAAVGGGAVLGSLGASALVGSRGLGAWFALGVALWGAPLVLIGLFPGRAAAIVLLLAVGVGNALVDVSGFSLMARLAPDEILARAFGVFEALIALSVGLGSILTPAVIAAIDVRGALIALGCVCPLAAAAGWRRLRRIDRTIGARDAELARLTGVPTLRTLPLPVLDHLARHLVRRSVPAGQAVFEQGAVADRFYVIAAGEADVVGDGKRIRTLGAGDAFGEIGLLRDVPRTAAIHARSALELYGLDRAVFVPAVSGYRPSAAAADAVVASMLDTFRPRGIGV